MTRGLKPHDDRASPSPGERVVLVLSIAATLGLFAYVGWHAWHAPADAAPRVEVVGVEEGPGGEPAARVRLVNEGGVGLQDATVEVTCGEDPPVELQFEHVPAGGDREGQAACPGGEPEARIVAWREA